MGRLLNIVNQLHRRTARDYVGRMCDDKVHCMRVGREYGKDYSANWSDFSFSFADEDYAQGV